jgi:hypothetical protein
LIKRLLKNKKGTAEVIGSVMFIIILLFFFTNVYLWHDAAVKEMNDLQIQKINTKIDATINNNGALTVTNNGAMDVSLAWLWVNEKSSSGSPDISHQPFDLHNVVIVGGGSSVTIQVHIPHTLTENTVVKVITTTGTIEPCPLIP